MISSKGRLLLLKKRFHRLACLGYPFFVLGLYSMGRFFFFSADDAKIGWLSTALLSMGIFMSFISMSDAGSVTKKEGLKIIKKQARLHTQVIGSLIGFILTTFFGLFVLFIIRDFSLGVAIATFGIGGIALQKFHLDRYLAVLGEEADSE
ncbi:MAG TPA: hypothetical protein ENN72_08080 [Firmicutes bacterium]|nr:hypothetical protein [Bacillota bacterium]